MAVSVSIRFDRRLFGNPALQRVLWNAARMVRDLWLSRAPTVSGDYARGLQRPGSVIVKPGEIRITNFAKHATWYETGTRPFNWGLRFLANSPRAKIAADGSKYAVIKIEAKGGAKFRRESVGAAVIAAFQQTVPRGRTKFAGYKGIGSLGSYQSPSRLAKPLKGRKPGAGAMSGFFTVSERAIRENPKLWFHERVPGKRLAADVKREAQPIVERALAQAAAAEAARAARR